MTQRPPSPKPPGSEPLRTSRRGALRATGLNIAATYMLEGQRLTLRGAVVDLSATGAQLLVSKSMAPGQLMHIDFAIPKGPHIKTQATVARCKPATEGRFAAGVSLAVSVDEELAIAQWVFEHVSPG